MERTHQPYAFAAKTSDPNLPSLREALNGEHAEDYWKAMMKEIEDLEKRGTWEYMDKSSLPANAYIVPVLWAMRRKTYPDGTHKKFKGRLTLRGDLMKKNKVGGDMDSYSPVCQWTSVRLVMVLSLIMDLQTESIDFSNAFVQAVLPPDQQIFMEVPIGFKTPRPGQVLKLKKSLYGSTFAPLQWYKKCDKGLRD